MKIITIIGARPQFIKAAAVSRAIRRYNQKSSQNIQEIIIHTGQHFDKNMSDIFFSELEIPKPDYNLEIANLSHGAMTGRMLEAIERVLQEQQPDIVLIYGDTNSTLAGALASSKMNIPVAHIEAGLRSFNMKMPEEVNRILSDHISTWLFCPTETSVQNLQNEGVTENVYNVGDVMYDITLYYRDKAKQQIDLGEWKVKEGEYILCTIHRAENTDDTNRLSSIFKALRQIASQTNVLLPIHPRTQRFLKKLNKEHWLEGITVLEPLPYLEMLRLEMGAKAILTDSGGVQKEAFFHRVPCITLRDETEWVETVMTKWNVIVSADTKKIVDAYHSIGTVEELSHNPYGKGYAAQSILDILTRLQTS
jgi:UDP-GlcNAc3NAcA epimerase